MTAQYVTVLVIEHRHGTEVWMHNTPEGAERSRIGWAETWGDEEMPSDVPKPADPEEMADAYFDHMAGTESWWAETQVVQD